MKLLRAVRLKGNSVVPGYAKKRLEERGMTMVDVDNVLRWGRIDEEGEFEGGQWRYRVKTDRMAVVVAFRSHSELAVVTVWSKR